MEMLELLLFKINKICLFGLKGEKDFYNFGKNYIKKLLIAFTLVVIIKSSHMALFQTERDILSETRQLEERLLFALKKIRSHFGFEHLHWLMADRSKLNIDSVHKALAFKTLFFEAMSNVIHFSELSDKQIFKFTLRNMKLRVDDGFWPMVSEEDVLELYNSDFLQIGHNISFMKFCSYHPSDLYLKEWWELFHRDEKMTVLLADLANKVFQGKVNKYLEAKVPSHSVKEIASHKKYQLNVEQGVMAPVYDREGCLVACLTALKAAHI